MSKANKKPGPRGRPVKNTMPEPIPDTAENIATVNYERTTQEEMGLHEGSEDERIQGRLNSDLG